MKDGSLQPHEILKRAQTRSERALRVWHTVNPPAEPEYHYCATVQIASKTIKELIDQDQLDETIKANAFGLEIYNPSIGWEEYYDEQGRDIQMIMDEEGDEDANNP